MCVWSTSNNKNNRNCYGSFIKQHEDYMCQPTSIPGVFSPLFENAESSSTINEDSKVCAVYKEFTKACLNYTNLRHDDSVERFITPIIKKFKEISPNSEFDFFPLGDSVYISAKNCGCFFQKLNENYNDLIANANLSITAKNMRKFVWATFLPPFSVLEDARNNPSLLGRISDDVFFSEMKRYLNPQQNSQSACDCKERDVMEFFKPRH
jgi:hypothetical protein